MRQTFIDLVERAYRLDEGNEGWLAGLVDVAESLLPTDGYWVAGWTFTLGSQSQPEIDNLISLRGGDEAKQRILAASLLAPKDHSRSYFAPRACVSLATAFGGTENLRRAPFWKPEWKCEDLLMVKSLDVTGRGCMLFAPTAQLVSVTEAMEVRWRQAMAHINAGMRVRLALEGLASPTDSAEAILESDGRAVHASGEARTRQARVTLREALRVLDRSRGPLRREDPDGALAAWQGLVTGRWSLLDHFDSDGRRYILARRNDPNVSDPRGLTLQERQIARYAALGLANKFIAYTLGLSEARVSQVIASATQKLGLRDRADLVYALARDNDAGRPS
jgi:DNA-binding CsgD family transcriptional regulator